MTCQYIIAVGDNMKVFWQINDLEQHNFVIILILHRENFHYNIMLFPLNFTFYSFNL